MVTIVERKTRMCIWTWVDDHTADVLIKAVAKAFMPYGDRLEQVFKRITADNGSKFARLSEVEDQGMGVYFTHPFSSFEKGINECHNKMMHRFIPKGRSMADYTQEDIDYFADRMGGLPRRILGYSMRRSFWSRSLTGFTGLANLSRKASAQHNFEPRAAPSAQSYAAPE